MLDESSNGFDAFFTVQNGMNALHLSAKYGHSNIVEVIENNTSAIEAKTSLTLNQLWQTVSSKTGFNVLHVATKFGNVSAVTDVACLRAPLSTLILSPQAWNFPRFI